MVVLPTDFFSIEPSSWMSVSFGGPTDDNSNEIIITSKIKVGQGDIIEIYMNHDILLALANNLPKQMTLQTSPEIMK